jgi:urease accessory protein
VIAGARAVIGAGGLLRAVVSQPPVTLRQVLAEDPSVCTLCVVGSAAGPLAGDRIALDLRVEPHARAVVIATGASLAQGRPGAAPGRLSTTVTLAEGAELTGRPAPLIACAGSAVEVRLDLALAGTAALRWREVVVLGRLGEPAGQVCLDWRVSRAGQPVLRQRVELTDPELLRWPGMLDGATVLATALVTGPQVRARTVVGSPTAVCQRVDDQTALVTVLDQDAASAEVRLERLLGEFDGG